MEPKTRLERFLAAIAGDDVSLDLPKTRIEKYLARILARVSKGGDGSLPAVTSADNGKVLGVVDGAWTASEQGKKFIVTLTPTALDYSGTMDKTVAEINAAYEAGQEIWFRVYAGTSYSDVPLASYGNNGSTYPSFNANFLYDEAGVLVLIYTGTTDDGTRQTYFTKVYALTPAS